MNEQFAYLETQVMTASPPKLRLMVIEAGLQQARRSLQAMEFAPTESTLYGFERLRKIILHLLTSLEGPDGGLAQRMQRVYTFLYREVALAQLKGDRQMMSDVIQVLEIERETWQEMTQRFVTESATRSPKQPERTVSAAAIGTAHASGSRLCLEG